MTTCFDLDAWCAAVPGLRKTGERLWKLAAQSGISYPADSHMSLAEVESTSYWFNHRNHVIIAAVRNFPPNGPIFDIGGGNGYVSVGLSRAGFDCVVVEPGPVGATNASARGFAVIQAPFQDLSITDCTLPAAGLFDVLEHIENDDAALANLHRVLKPGGRLYLAVPAYRFLRSEEDKRAGHFRRYNLPMLHARLEKAGFQVEYGSYFFRILLVPIFLLRALPSRLHLFRRDAKVADDHMLPAGLRNAFAYSLGKEVLRIAAGKSISFGASCLVVARKG